MTHGTTDRGMTWCGDYTHALKSYTPEVEEVTCLDCLQARVIDLQYAVSKIAECKVAAERQGVEVFVFIPQELWDLVKKLEA